ncbi:unnamed protein product [Cuscuta epithymum]|uniref:Uncharacterized protein n=1 Tax=Cuscuta epithymum TaxID=186058 RepID=A0AAV0C506_9ASTE|nr:unnamed protein product [Cuscuta epithymum]
MHMPEPQREETCIPFNEFVESAEEFGDQVIAGLNKMLVLNQKHDAHLDLVQYNLESDIAKLSSRLSILTTSLQAFMKTSNEKVDNISTEVASIHTVLFSHSQTLTAQDKAIKELSDAVDDLQWSHDKNAEHLTDVEELCKTNKEFALKLINSGKDRDHKLVLLEANTKNIQSAVDKQKELIEGLASVTQTLPGVLETIKENNATEFSKIRLLLGDLVDAKKGEDTREQARATEGPSSRSLSVTPVSDPAIYYERARQKRLAAGIQRPPPPRSKKGKKTASTFTLNQWLNSDLSNPDSAQFSEIKKHMTPLQKENLIQDKDGLIIINHGGSVQEAEEWWRMRVTPGKDISEAIRNYLDCKLETHWSEYQNPRNLATIRARVNEELKKAEEAEKRLEEEGGKRSIFGSTSEYRIFICHNSKCRPFY